MNKILLLLSAILVLASSCASKKNILLFQDLEEYKASEDSTYSSIRIKKNDLLTIIVSTEDKKSAVPFNLTAVTSANSDLTSISGQQRLQTYLVNNDGQIQFPVLGDVELIGKTTIEATNFIKSKLLKYIKNPIVNLRITNFKVSVLGEVTRPGTFIITDERITILEALSRAGDMTIFGKRTDVLVIREQNGVKSHHRLDLTSKNLLSSPCYFLQQNDVVIVSPNGAQVQSSASNRNSGLFVSIAGVIITVISILTR